MSLLQCKAESHHVGESGEVTLVCLALTSWGYNILRKDLRCKIADVVTRGKGRKSIWLNLVWSQVSKSQCSRHLSYCAEVKARSGGGDFSGMWYFPMTHVNVFVEIKRSSQTLVAQA